MPKVLPGGEFASTLNRALLPMPPGREPPPAPPITGPQCSTRGCPVKFAGGPPRPCREHADDQPEPKREPEPGPAPRLLTADERRERVRAAERRAAAARAADRGPVIYRTQDRARADRDDLAASMFRRGATASEVAAAVGLSAPGATHLRRALDRAGLIPPLTITLHVVGAARRQPGAKVHLTPAEPFTVAGKTRAPGEPLCDQILRRGIDIPRPGDAMCPKCQRAVDWLQRPGGPRNRVTIVSGPPQNPRETPAIPRTK